MAERALLCMPQALDLVDVYEASDHGPLFLKPSAPGTFSRLRSDQSASDPHVIDRAMLFLQQTLIDYVYSPGALAPCSRSTFEGRGWQTSRHYPGRADPPADGSVVHSVLVDGSLPRFWGVQVAFATEDARRPTGFYLSPGQVATVTVPESMIQTENAKQFKILVGGQTSDNTIKDMHRRMDRTTVTYRIRAVTTLVTNPLGGALYILVPYLADAGVVEIRITGGVVPSPHFRRVSFHAMTNADWQVARGAAGPWADFETDHFMLNVPTSWVYNLPDAVDLMRHYNLAMDGASEWLLLQFPAAPSPSPRPLHRRRLAHRADRLRGGLPAGERRVQHGCKLRRVCQRMDGARPDSIVCDVARAGARVLELQVLRRGGGDQQLHVHVHLTRA